jgi:signal transduction histidine kinase
MAVAREAPTSGTTGLAVSRLAALAAVLVVTALVSGPGEWEPLWFVALLGVLYAIVDSMSVWARRARLSAGLTVQLTAAALLGPGPAVVLSVFSNAVDWAVNRVPAPAALTNLAMIPAMGLLSGLLFEAGGAVVDEDTPAYAALVPPVYFVVMAVNTGLFAAFNPALAGTDRRPLLRETVLPMLPWAALNCVLTAAVVLAGALSGPAAAASLLVALVVTMPMLRSLGALLKTRDDLESLQAVSDERLLTEVLNAEGRERARLAESLHDGPLQRLVALRQTAAESAPGVTEQLDAAIAEARGIITAFHPDAARELGFEASLRAALAPFPSARQVTLRVCGEVSASTATVLLPIAQELLVNAVKHARPEAIDVSVTESAADIVLEVSDDGVGFVETARAGHVGLAIVRRRVEHAGGSFEIATRDGGGTRTRAVLPTPPR